MRRQPKARSTKAKFRQDAFYDLVSLSRSGPKKDVKADFGAGQMARQVCVHTLQTWGLYHSVGHSCQECQAWRVLQ